MVTKCPKSLLKEFGPFSNNPSEEAGEIILEGHFQTRALDLFLLVFPGTVIFGLKDEIFPELLSRTDVGLRFF